jgi:hypothetical protein
VARFKVRRNITMTDNQHADDTDETIEDLDAPLVTQQEVAGGAACGRPSVICGDGASCFFTAVNCTQMSHRIEVYEQ